MSPRLAFPSETRDAWKHSCSTVDLDFAIAMTSGGAPEAIGKSSAPALVEDGRAKVNLTLRVVGRRVDGYHDLESVVAFADCADRLTLMPGRELHLNTTGPLAQACGEPADNLVLKAARLLGEQCAGFEDGQLYASQGAAGRRRYRWRFGRCRSGAAAAGESQRTCSRRCAAGRSRANDRRRRAGLSRLARLRHDRGW